MQLPETLQQIETDALPSHLCTYLYELAGIFMRFYEACPILKADAQTKLSRLALAQLTANTLSEGLGLLGFRYARKDVVDIDEPSYRKLICQDRYAGVSLQYRSPTG